MMRFFLVAFICNVYLVECDFYFNCNDNPCQHGKCIDLYRQTAYECQCDQGWEGLNCDKPIQILKLNNSNNLGEDYDFKHNKCHGECLNGGTCNKIAGVCECRNQFYGDYCEHHVLIHTNADIERIYSNIDQCKHECMEKKFSNGHVCHFKYLDSLKACQCNITSGFCSPVLENFLSCQSDCQRYVSSHKYLNTTKYCSYFYKDIGVRVCRCINEPKNWCTIYKSKVPQNTFSNTLKAGLSLFLIVAVLYIARLVLANFIDMIASTCDLCFRRPSRTELVHSNSFEVVPRPRSSESIIDSSDSTELVKNKHNIAESVNV